MVFFFLRVVFFVVVFCSSLRQVRLTPGPLPLVFALLVVYYAIVPPSKPRLFGALGMEFTDKAFTFAVAGMVSSLGEGIGDGG